MTATTLDDRRRVVLPPEFKAKSAVTIQMIDEETALVKLVKPAKARLVMLLPDVKRFREDPEWEKTESAIVAHNNKKVTLFEE